MVLVGSYKNACRKNKETLTGAEKVLTNSEIVHRIWYIKANEIFGGHDARRERKAGNNAESGDG